MSTNLFRYSGIAAIVSASAYVASLIISIAAPALGPVAFGCVIISTLLFVVVAFALFRTHQSESSALSLIAFLTSVAGSIGGLMLDPTQINAFYAVMSLLFAVGVLVFGWLGHQSPRLPRGLGIVAIVVGVLGLIMTVAAFAGASFDMVGLLNLALTVPYVVWLFWLGRYWLANPVAVQH
jgi:hypothetical protein